MDDLLEFSVTPLVQSGNFALQLGHQLHQRVDHLVTLRQRLRLARLDPWGEFCNRLGRLHHCSFALQRQACKLDFASVLLAE